jgi:hypothetical protein
VSRAALDELRQTVARVDEAGLLGDRDPEGTAVALRAVVHGLAEFENIGLLGPNPEAQWRSVLSAIFDGYLQTPAAAAA